MEKLISIIEKTLVPVANKLSQNKYLSAISGGCMSTLGIIMVGAVFTILTNISWQPYTDLLASTGIIYRSAKCNNKFISCLYGVCCWL